MGTNGECKENSMGSYEERYNRCKYWIFLLASTSFRLSMKIGKGHIHQSTKVKALIIVEHHLQ